MLSIFEQYAHDNNIMFNVSKSQIFHFGKNDDQAHTVKLLLRMKYDQLIPYTKNVYI